MNMNSYARLASFLALLTPLLACSTQKTGDADSAAMNSPGTPGSCPTNNSGIVVPAGFCVTVFADHIGEARHVAVAPNGDVYVAIQAPGSDEKASTNAGTTPAVIALRDTTHDGVADLTVTIGDHGNTGVAVYSNYLYVDKGPQLVRYPLPSGQLQITAQPEVIVTGIPFEPGHRARNFAIGSDGALYLNVGSATNSCQLKDRTPESKGIDPCTELNTRAGIWRFDANKTNQQFTPGALRDRHSQRDGCCFRTR